MTVPPHNPAEITSPAEELRAAAQKIRDTANGLPATPWIIDELSYGCQILDGTGNPIIDSADPERALSEDLAAHIAMWHPGTALAVADLLDGMAEYWHGVAPEDYELFTTSAAPLAALARAINGEAANS